MFKLQFEGTVQKQRFWLGVLCGALPILCLLFGVLSCTYGGIRQSYWIASAKHITVITR